MNFRITTLLALMLATPVALAGNTPMCDRLDDDTRDININSDFNFEGDEIRLRDEDDKEIMVITEDRRLYYMGEELDLTPRGRQLVGTYYDTFEDAMNDFTNLGMEAASLGVDAAAVVVSALFSGDFDEKRIEEEMKSKAEGIEASADAACAKLGALEGIEIEMAQEIDGFEPVLFKH